VNQPVPAEDVRLGCEALVRICADVKPGDRALIVSDQYTWEIGEGIERVARAVTGRVTHRVIPPLTMHGQEPPEDVAADMAGNDVIFGVTRMSMAHSHARFRASQRGARYVSLPDYSFAVLASPALRADFRALMPISKRLADLLTDGTALRLQTALGTDLTCQIGGRVANVAPGWCWGPGALASPPDAETNIAPLEDGSQGTVVVDGSIPCAELGLLQEPLRLTVERGRVVRVQGLRADTLNELFDRLGTPATRIVAEFGIGLNPLAELRGYMLEDEGCLGTAHLGMGANATVGGTNSVSFHLDHIIREVTVSIDGRMIIEHGRIVEGILR
jgi:leucyl aminopeptidase (aminopeptidase T)